MRIEGTKTDFDTAEMPRVRIHARIVPNGAVRKRAFDKDGCPVADCADEKLRATLLLVPELVPDAEDGEDKDKGGVRLDQWPGEIHRLLKGGLRALVIPVKEGQSGGHVACGIRKQLTFTAPGLARITRDSDIEALCGMWLGSLWHDIPGKEKITTAEWKMLGQRIAKSLGGSTVSSKGFENANNTAPDSELYGQDGQLAPTAAAGNAEKVKVVSALDIRHADLAVALEHQRATALAASLKVACEGGKKPCAKALPRKNAAEEVEFWSKGKPKHSIEESSQHTEEEKDKIRRLLAAIAKSKPREISQSFTAYAKRLAQAADPAFSEQKDVETLLRKEAVVIAELRRRRLTGERTALFNDLSTERGVAASTYQKAKLAIDNKDCLDKTDPEWRNGAMTPGDAAKGGDDFDQITKAARYANWPQYRKPGEEQTASDGDAASETADRLAAALRSFFTMQSTPTLARATMLAIDLEVDLTGKDATDVVDMDVSYAQIRAELAANVEAVAPRPWTLFRLREFDASSCYHFWPVSREEADCRGQADTPPEEGKARHYGGLMVMGFGSDADAALNVPRFDVTSLDIRTAVELELQRRSIAQANKDAETEVKAQMGASGPRVTQGAAVAEGKTLPPGVNLPGEDTDIEDEGDRQDVGLSLLDRGLCTQAIRKMAARDAKMRDKNSGAICEDDGRQAVVLDAEDLTTGYRLYVGTPGTSCTKWHPMMSRAIKFGTTGPKWRYSERIEPLLTLLLGRAGSPERVALESAAMNVPGRMLPKQRAPDPSNDNILETEAVFEQAVSVWDGGPMGVDCGVRPGAEKTTPDTMIFGRELSIPDGSRYAIPRLRYGRPYRFALATVFSGGRSVSGVDFPSDDGKTDIQADLYYPSERMTRASQACVEGEKDCDAPVVKPFVRALRQAKIGAPQVLLPGGHANRVNGPMGPDQAGLMLVRSLDKNDKNPDDRRFTSRGQPASARRVVLIPSIPLARAATHMGDPEGNAGANESPVIGVFDNLAATPTTTGGLTFVRLQPGGCGFPAIKTRYLKGLNGVQHFSERRIEDKPSDVALEEGDDLDGAVFKAGTARDSAYYPDPAAETLAIRVRLHSGTERWLTMENDPKQKAGFHPVDLIQGHSYPDRRRLLFTLKQLKTRTTTPDNLSKLLTLTKSRRFDPAHQGSFELSGKFLAREVTLRLAPHEWAVVEMWLVPSAKRLARDFAVIQTLGIQLSQLGEQSVGATIENMCAGAGLCLPDEVTAKLVSELRSIGGGKAFFGSGGVTAPPMQALLSLAEAVRRCMIAHPIPEISAVSRLQAVHASNRATAQPAIVEAPVGEGFVGPAPTAAAMTLVGKLHPLRAFRPEEAAVGPGSKEPAAVEEGKPNSVSDAPVAQTKPEMRPKVCTDIDAPLKVASKGSSALVLTGDVKLDLNQIDTIEVRARMAFPGSSTFDDRLRGRSLALRRAGWWPLVDNPSGAAPDADSTFRDSQSLFGFRVRPDGRTEFDRAEVTLLRAEQLPRPDGTACEDTVKLRRLFEERDIGDVRVTERHLFPDGKARRMQVWINGLPRTAQFMRTADRRLRAGDPWVASEGLHFEVGDLVKGEELRAEAQCRFSDEVEVVLPATIRPAKPDARAPVPIFQHEKPLPAAIGRDSLIHWRRSVIRIPLGREWFSSGEDERLGIVLWPPKISPDDHWKLSQNKVTLRRDNAFGGVREIDLNDLRKFRFLLTKRKLADIMCNPLGGRPEGEAMPFEDGHLGAGGRFVSRRGADPVREGNPHRQILFSPGDFPDLDLDEDDPQCARLVETVEMPLSDDDAPNGKAEEEREKLPPLMVSLLTYAPRFDPEKELWYVDVTLEDSDAAETFVRFGLVRYQPHTRPGLRCSRPVRQFVQPLPDRIADVSRITLARGGGVQVRLCGPTFYRRRVSQALHKLLKPGIGPVTVPEDDPFVAAECSYEDVSDLLHGADAAPRMKVTLFRNGTDATKRPYREMVPLPVSAVGREHGLLLPADHDTGVIGPENFEGKSGDHVFRLNPEHEVSAGSVAVKAALTAEGEGIWLLKIPEEVLGGFEGLELQIEEVEATEPADPPTFDELARAPVQSRIDTRTLEDEQMFDTGTPNARVNGLHHGGARMRAIFDLSGWAID